MPLTRRDFLKAGAFAALAPATLRAADAKKPPSERVRLGCIGVKNQGMGDIKGFLKKENAPNCQIVAVCDVDRDVLGKAQEFVEKQTEGKVATYADYRKLLDNKDIDAVVIVTPDHWHAIPTIQACQAGKDVYCEKPLTHTVVEGRAIAKAAAKHKAIVQTGSQQRSEYKGYFRTAAELVRNGKLGKLKEVRVGLSGVNFAEKAVPGAKDTTPPANLDYDFWLGPAPLRAYNVNRVHYNFRFFWDYAGGQFSNWGAHHLDIVQWALGMDESGPVKVELKSVEFDPNKEYEVSKSSHVVLSYADGTTVQVGQGMKGKEFPGGCTFIGEKGTIHVDRSKLEIAPKELADWKPGSGDTKLYVAESGNHMANWLACIQSRKAPICAPEIGHRSATVTHLCNIAVRTGRPIRWDPAAEMILGDQETAAMLTKEYRKGYELPAL